MRVLEAHGGEAESSVIVKEATRDYDTTEKSVRNQLSVMKRTGEVVSPGRGRYKLPDPDKPFTYRTRRDGPEGLRHDVDELVSRIEEIELRTGLDSDADQSEENFQSVEFYRPKNFEGLPPIARSLAAPDGLIYYRYVPNGVGASMVGRDNSEEAQPTLGMTPHYMYERFGYIPDPVDHYCFNIIGDSMEPYLKQGQMCWAIRVRGIREAARYALSYNGIEEFCKRVSRIGSKRLRIQSDNKAYPVQHVQWIEGDEYRDVESSESLTLHIHGLVIDPPDTGHAVTQEIIAAFSAALSQRG